MPHGLSDEEFSRRMAGYVEQTRGIIERVGWMVQGVGSDEENGDPQFAYSVGLSKPELRFPEIMMVGAIPFETMNGLINDVAFLMLKRQKDFQQPSGKQYLEACKASFPQVLWDYDGDVGVLPDGSFANNAKSNKVLKNHPVIFRQIDPPTVEAHCQHVFRIYGPNHAFKVLHMVLPDKEKRFPWDKGYNLFQQRLTPFDYVQ